MTTNDRFYDVMKHAKLVLAEAAVCERLRRMEGITLHPTLFTTPLIYEKKGALSLEEIYGRYRTIALNAGIPILLCAPTWRADRDRITKAKVSYNINHDAVKFMLRLRDRWDQSQAPVLVGGLIGPKNDCYRPQEGLTEEDARKFHQWQVDQLAQTGVDVLLAQTMPAVPEATGLARAMAATRRPYIISFVINRQGEVFDGTPLAQAINTMDDALKRSPYGYMVNCAYPSFICANKQPTSLFQRLLGIQANSSSKDQLDLDGSTQTLSDSIEDWADQMLILHCKYDMKILGGCCGTDDRYLEKIAYA